MRRRVGGVAVVGAALALGFAAAPAAAAPPGGQSAFGLSHRPVCAGVPKGFVRCHSEVVTDARGKPLATSGPSGYGPADLQSAYGIGDQASSAGADQTIAIVDAYDDPKAESDLGVYRSQYGLPPCTTANGCFRKVNQNGGTTPPSANSSWAEEISLDLDMASAICPHCKILLVEASSNSADDLDAAVDRAATLGATQISNSYGGSEYSGETSEESHFNHPGIAITVSSGDSGYGVEYPAASRYVTAVGGTSLTRSSSSRGWSETAWSGAGSGCSAYISKPSWQTDSGCSRRTVADVSAVADPNTGVSVYDSYNDPGWMVFGGTSVAAPIVAGFDALIGSAAGSPSYPYAHTGSYYDVTSGSNARRCTPSYLCTAGVGYDGPTGLGTPKTVNGPSNPVGGSGGGSSGGSTTTASAGGTTTSSAPPPPAPDVVAPIISSARLSRSVFRSARSGPAFAVARGTRLRVTLSEASTLTFRLQRARPGRRVHGRCVRPTSRNRRARRCTRWVYLRGRVRRSAHAGSNLFRFRGRWRGHRLRLGRYRLVLVAVDAAGNRGHARRVRFRIVR